MSYLTRGFVGLLVALLCSSAAWAGPILTSDQQNVGVPFQGFVIPGGASVGQGFMSPVKATFWPPLGRGGC